MSGDDIRPRSGAKRPIGRIVFDDGDNEGPRPRRKARRSLTRHGTRRLFTATIAMAYERHVMLVFHASIAGSVHEVRLRLKRRLGDVGASLARIQEGYDDRSFIARSMVAPSLRELIREVEGAPDGAAAAGFDVQHVQVVGVQP